MCLKYKKKIIQCVVIDGLYITYSKGMSKIRSVSAFSKHYKYTHVETMEQVIPVRIKNFWFLSDSTIRLYTVNDAQRFQAHHK